MIRDQYLKDINPVVILTKLQLSLPTHTPMHSHTHMLIPVESLTTIY